MTARSDCLFLWLTLFISTVRDPSLVMVILTVLVGLSAIVLGVFYYISNIGS